MSGRISLKPYYQQRDNRLNCLFSTLYSNLPKLFPKDLVLIIVDLTMDMEDLDNITKNYAYIVGGMNGIVKDQWARMMRLGMGTCSFYSMNMERTFKVYNLPEEREFLYFLVNGSTRASISGVFSVMFNKKDFADVIAQQLHKIKTRNKYYWTDNEEKVKTQASYRKRYRTILDRDMDTVRKLIGIIDSIQEIQKNYINKIDKSKVPFDRVGPSHCKFCFQPMREDDFRKRAIRRFHFPERDPNMHEWCGPNIDIHR